MYFIQVILEWISPLIPSRIPTLTIAWNKLEAKQLTGSMDKHDNEAYHVFCWMLNIWNLVGIKTSQTQN